jgi:hypothetical protein
MFILLLMFALLLGLLPIPKLRAQILAVQGTLAATVGDSLAFVESPLRAALIRTRVLDRLKRLKQRCERTIIVAHSQGAAVVLDALGGILDPAREGGHAAQADAPAPDIVPDTLLTFGAGINQLASLKVLSAGLPLKIEINPVFFAVGALVLAAGLSTWLYVDIRAQRTTILAILYVAVLVPIGSAVFAFIAWLAQWLTSVFGKRWHAVQKHQVGILTWSLTLLLLALSWLYIYYRDQSDLPYARVFLLVAALVSLVGSISITLSKEMRTAVTIVRKPPALRRWIDLYASADPVPNGPTRTAQTGELESFPILNLGSIFADHTAYWDNLDGFVLRVVRACAETAESPWRARLPPDRLDVDTRAAWRVGWLRLARWTVGVSWLLVGATLWIRHSNDVPLPFKLPSWLPMLAVMAERLVVLAVLIAVAYWISVDILHWLWGQWVRAEQETVLARLPHRNRDFTPLLGINMFVWIIVSLGLWAVRVDVPSALGELSGGLGYLVDWLLTVFLLAFISTSVLLFLKPAPRTAEAESKATAANPPTSVGSPDSL